jgi:hypothetical protein
MKPTAIIQEWNLILDRHGNLTICGVVYSDSHRRWEDGTKIIITDVEYFIDNIAVTQHGIFELSIRKDNG